MTAALNSLPTRQWCDPRLRTPLAQRIALANQAPCMRASKRGLSKYARRLPAGVIFVGSLVSGIVGD